MQAKQNHRKGFYSRLFCLCSFKLASEELLKAQVQISPNGLVGYNLRLFNTFGPYQVAQFAIPKFLSAVKNKIIIINGNGKQIRSYCYVDDTVEAIFKCLIKKA